MHVKIGERVSYFILNIPDCKEKECENDLYWVVKGTEGKN